MIVLFDMDGVLASFGAGFRKIAETLGKDPNLGSHRIEDLDRECWEVVLASETFWHDLPAIVPEQTFKRIYMLTRKADLYFVTNRHGNRAKRQTERWLEDRGIMSPTVIITPHKGETAYVVSATHAIEDNPDNALSIAIHSEAQSYLLDLPNNRGLFPSAERRLRRIASVDAFLDAIE